MELEDALFSVLSMSEEMCV